MFSSLRQVFVAFVVASTRAEQEAEQCRGCLAGEAGSASLLQRRSELERLPPHHAGASHHAKQPLPLLTPGHATQGWALQPEHGSGKIYADAIDKDCAVGGGCSPQMGGLPADRAACVSKALGHNECWDICNLAHKPADYQTGNVMLDIRVHETVEAIRKGSYASVTCPSQTDEKKDIKNANDEAAQEVAEVAALDNLGYIKVVAWKNHAGMEVYIRRVVRNAGCRVADESKLQGVVPFYSGESASQTYANLEAEIYKACTASNTWLSSLYPHSKLSHQETQRDGDDTSQISDMLGSTAPLNEVGFQQVVKSKDDLQVLKYVRRVVSMLHGWVIDESGLNGLLPFFTGEKSVNTLGALILEIEGTMQKPDGWVMKAPVSLRQVSNSSGDDEDIPGTPLLDGEEDEEVKKRLDEVESRKKKGGAKAFQECPDDDIDELNMLNHTAWMVPLDAQGYEALTQLKSDCAMMTFAERVIAELHCHVVDESGLKGLVPFYSGRHEKQDLSALRLELKGACTMSGRFLVPDVKYWAEHPEGDEDESAIASPSTSTLSYPAAVESYPAAESANAAGSNTDDITPGEGFMPQESAEDDITPGTGFIQHDEITPGEGFLPHGEEKVALLGHSKAWRRNWACHALGVFCPPKGGR